MSELTNTILITASKLMQKFGISSVTMDDIAKECHISKRTLYEHIPDKRTLVWNSVLFNKEKKQTEVMKLLQEAPSTLAALLHIYRYMRGSFTESTSIFFKDMHRLYPDIEKKCREFHREQAESLGAFLTKGVDEGMFRTDINFATAADVFTVQAASIMKELSTTNELKTVQNMIDTAFVIFLRGIATHKGLEIIDEFLKENNI